MKKTFDFGKIKYTNKKRAVNLVTVDVELRRRGGETTFTIDQKTGEKTITGKTPEYVELAISGAIWNARRTDCVCGGQCLDEIYKYRKQLSEPELFNEIYDLWKKYHLNGMHAGTPEQEAAIKEWEAAGNRYDYKVACEMLKKINLYKVNYTGASVGRMYNNEPYKYGQAWLIQELPGNVLLRIEHLLSV